MVMILVFDLYFKTIILLFFMMLFSNYAVYLVFTDMTSHSLTRNNESIVNSKGFKYANIIIHILYVVKFSTAFSKYYGARCSADAVYRKFNLIGFIF